MLYFIIKLFVIVRSLTVTAGKGRRHIFLSYLIKNNIVFLNKETFQHQQQSEFPRSIGQNVISTTGKYKNDNSRGKCKQSNICVRHRENRDYVFVRGRKYSSY